MKYALLLAGSALTLTMLSPDTAEARPGMRRHGYGSNVVRRGPVARPGYVYRGYRRGPGWGPAVGLGVFGAAALGAAAIAPSYGYGYGYADPCLRQQQVYDVYGRVVLQTVRVC